MRTTLNLPDDLYQQAKIAAAETSVTVTSLVEQGLRAVLAQHQASTSRPAKRPRLFPVINAGPMNPEVVGMSHREMLDWLDQNEDSHEIVWP